MTAAELRQVVERTDDTPAKKLSQPERARRLEEQKKRLTGFLIQNALEPADRLVDAIKMPELSKVCPMLGIELDVSDLSLGIRIVNRPGRVEEVKAAVRGFFERGEIGTRDMLRMMGRVQFADAQVMGRAGKLALVDARSWSRNHAKCIPLIPGLRDAFEILLQRLTSGAPRLIPCGPCVHGRGIVTYYRRTLGATRRQAQVLRCQRSS